MTQQQQQCIYSHDFNNQHQHISIHVSIIKSTPIARKKIHQHICTYTYLIHQYHRHNNPTTIIKIINNITIIQHQNIIMTIIDIHIYIYIYIYINSSTSTLFQLNKSCNHTYSSKGHYTPYYDKHYI